MILGFSQAQKNIILKNSSDYGLGLFSNVGSEGFEIDGYIVAVGRSHLISEMSDGAQSDFPGQTGPKTPPFSKLDADHRPAIQIRQMGTIDAYRRQGFAAEILRALEEASRDTFGAICGFLQAREVAIPFYQSQGWMLIDEPYSIPNVGPHRSMMKRF